MTFCEICGRPFRRGPNQDNVCYFTECQHKRLLKEYEEMVRESCWENPNPVLSAARKHAQHLGLTQEDEILFIAITALKQWQSLFSEFRKHLNMKPPEDIVVGGITYRYIGPMPQLSEVKK